MCRYLYDVLYTIPNVLRFKAGGLGVPGLMAEYILSAVNGGLDSVRYVVVGGQQFPRLRIGIRTKPVR